MLIIIIIGIGKEKKKMLVVAREIDLTDFYDLKDICWSGAITRLDEIEELGLEEEFFNYVVMMFEFNEEVITETDINDFIWFECDKWIEEHKQKEEEK